MAGFKSACLLPVETRNSCLSEAYIVWHDLKGVYFSWQEFILARSWQDSCQDSCQDLGKIFLGKILARFLARSWLDFFLGRSCQESWQDHAKILPRSCQELKLEQSWQDLMSSCQDLGKILLRSQFLRVYSSIKTVKNAHYCVLCIA